MCAIGGRDRGDGTKDVVWLSTPSGKWEESRSSIWHMTTNFYVSESHHATDHVIRRESASTVKAEKEN